MLLVILVISLFVVGPSGCHTPPPGKGEGRRITSIVEDWRDEIIYQVMVDRFADGDYSNNYHMDRRHLGKYQGGDWQGLIDKIPYLKELGVTALWISPVVKNLEEDAGFAGYHGYWAQDFLSVNQHFGDLAKLQELNEALHAAGMKVILDIVTNHIGQLFYYDINQNGQPDDILFGGGSASFGSRRADVTGKFTRTSEWDPDYDRRGIQSFTSLGESGPAPVVWVNHAEINRVPVLPQEFQNPNWYHRKGRVTVWENQQEAADRFKDCKPPWEGGMGERCSYIREQEIMGDFPGGLKDLATEIPDVRRALIRVFQYWIEVGDFDGFRIDTLKHVEHEFWKTFCPAMRGFAKQLGKQNFFMFGEAFTGDDTLLGEYTFDGQVDSVFYFSQMYRLRNVFINGAATETLRQLHEDRLKYYEAKPHPGGVGVAPRDMVVNFLDNHDVARFLYEGDVQGLHLALSYILTSIGVPSIYYGTEQQFAGGNDPGNREVMWVGNPKKNLPPYDTSNETFQHIKSLIEIRKKYKPLSRGDYTIRWATSAVGGESDAGIFAFERSYQGETVLVVINANKCTPSKKTSSTSAQGKLMPCAFAEKTELVNVMPGKNSNDRVTVQTSGGLNITVACRSTKIFVRQFADRSSQ